MAGDPTLYDALEVSPRAGQDVIDAAYRAIARRSASAAGSEQTGERQRELLEAAYGVLGAPAARQRYDAERLVRSHLRSERALSAEGRNALRSLGPPLLVLLRLEWRLLSTFFAGSMALFLIFGLVMGDLNAWSDLAWITAIATIITSATAVTQIASAWRMSLVGLAVTCLGWSALTLIAITAARWRLPSASGLLMGVLAGAFLFVFTLWQSSALEGASE